MNDTAPLRARLLAWYDANRRDLPWRARPGEAPDPYRVWLSEIMLQQTTVAAVRGYYEKFLANWPDVGALAAAPEEHIMRAWAGLGYYARARSLARCARAVAGELSGRFPGDEAGLLALPGIGPYTAAAIAAIAFDRPATVVDGNVERVIARLFAVSEPLPGAKREIRAHAATLNSPDRPGDFAQAMMDLGAGICAPRRPSCALCPLSGDCQARALGIAGDLPVRAPKPERPTRHGIAFFVERADASVLLRKRPPKGLLGAMMEVPSTAWSAAGPDDAEAGAAAPVAATWSRSGEIEHVFTHFRLILEVWRATVSTQAQLAAGAAPDRCRWVARGDLGSEALPSVMRKVVALALERAPSARRGRPSRP